MSLGPEETATRRLNFAQAFNPVGTNIGVLLAATLILPNLDEPVNMANLTPAEEHAIRAGELGAVMGPYLGLGFVLIAIALVIAIKKSPTIVEEYPDADLEGQSPVQILLSNRRYVFGVVAQFFNVAAPHSTTASAPRTVSTFVARIRPITHVIRNRETRNTIRLTCSR